MQSCAAPSGTPTFLPILFSLRRAATISDSVTKFGVREHRSMHPTVLDRTLIIRVEHGSMGSRNSSRKQRIPRPRNKNYSRRSAQTSKVSERHPKKENPFATGSVRPTATVSGSRVQASNCGASTPIRSKVNCLPFSPTFQRFAKTWRIIWVKSRHWMRPSVSYWMNCVKLETLKIRWW